jgi:hypothetical protein
MLLVYAELPIVGVCLGGLWVVWWPVFVPQCMERSSMRMSASEDGVQLDGYVGCGIYPQRHALWGRPHAGAAADRARHQLFAIQQAYLWEPSTLATSAHYVACMELCPAKELTQQGREWVGLSGAHRFATCCQAARSNMHVCAALRVAKHDWTDPSVPCNRRGFVHS